MTTPDPLRQLAATNGVDYWTVITRPRLWAKADAVHDLMATVRAGAQIAQGKRPQGRDGRFVKWPVA